MARDEASSSTTSSSSSPLQSFSKMPLSPWVQSLSSDERGLYLIHLLVNCANHVAAGNLDAADAFLDHISLLSCAAGDAMQRIAACFSDALARTVLRRTWRGLYRSLLLPTSVSAAAQAAARRYFLTLLPFVRVAAAVSNQAILEAMEGEKMVHIIDLDVSDPTQHLELLRLFATRQEGPPHLRITGVHDNKEVLSQVALCLTREAEKLDIPFQFNPIHSKLDHLDVESLRVKTGEALAINATLQLHRLLASNDQVGLMTNHFPSPDSVLSSSTSSSSFPSSKLDIFLASLWSLSPKIMLVTEQEANHNTGTFVERFVESINFYAALFDSLESNWPRHSAERARVEKELLGEEVKDILVGEGMERRERHERLERWVKRMEMVGFGKVGFSYYAMLHARRVLQGFGCDGYKVKEDAAGCFLLCWQDRPLFSVSAWRCRRF
ncbi:scarecrow-like protein 3 isoform X2 [Typha latifolia]